MCMLDKIKKFFKKEATVIAAPEQRPVAAVAPKQPISVPVVEYKEAIIAGETEASKVARLRRKLQIEYENTVEADIRAAIQKAIDKLG